MFNLRSIFLVLLALVITTCAPPSQHDRYSSRVVHIFFAPSLDGVYDWRQDQLVELRNELVEMQNLGPTFLEVRTAAEADIVVRDVDLGGGPSCSNGVARFVNGEEQIDPTCTQGYTDLRAAFCHETGHALGMQHICFSSGELPVCSPVGIGVANMNPHIRYGDIVDATSPGGTQGDPLGVATDVPTQLDLDEYVRTNP